MADLTKRDTIQLADGRRVDFIEYGDPDGAPAMYLHGTPSSAREARWLHDSALTAHVRVISIDRPGYQSSDPIASPAFEKSATSRERGRSRRKPGHPDVFQADGHRTLSFHAPETALRFSGSLGCIVQD